MHRRAISWISKREHLRIFRLAQTGLSRPGNMTTAKNKEENFIKNDLDKVKGYDYPFTNIVMEGGGSKGMAYVGALEVFEELGILSKITRICGASAGAIAGTLLAVGYSPKQLKEFLNQDLDKILLGGNKTFIKVSAKDRRWGILSFLPNMFSGYGWNPGNKFLEWFGDTLEQVTENRDITFQQILDRYEKELCIVVTNLSQMSTEYLHPKTTPEMPVRTAVRMSMSMPVVFQSVPYKMTEVEDIYVDGGFLCNYPIHAFDGWWLSMNSGDSFYNKFSQTDVYSKLYDKKERFGTLNPKTIGLLLFSGTETELMKEQLSHRPKNTPLRRPDTKLFRKRSDKISSRTEMNKQQKEIAKAISRFAKILFQKPRYSQTFLQVVHELRFDSDQVITRKELKEIYEKNDVFTKEDKMTLFGSEKLQDAMKQMDISRDDKITFHEVMKFLEKKDVHLRKKFVGYQRKDIKGLRDYGLTLLSALDVNVKRNYVQEEDIERTIGIDTDYIESTDFALEKEDKDFLIEAPIELQLAENVMQYLKSWRGRIATISFLLHYRKTAGRS